MNKQHQSKGMIIAAPGSGSGKTTITLALAHIFWRKGMQITPAKTGPDYIDTALLSEAANYKAINLDPWAMSPDQLRARASIQSKNADLLLIEGVMGLFDGAANGSGSTADLAAILQLPVILVVDAARQSQSIAALVSGFINWRKDVKISGIILNNVASERHKKILEDALVPLSAQVVGAIPRDAKISLSNRHLGLLLPDEIENFSSFVQDAAKIIATHCDIEKIHALASPVAKTSHPLPLAPLGQHIAIARDKAFAFCYQHWINDWKAAGAEISFFSPLDDEAVPKQADAVYLPGGYPELHAEQLSGCGRFFISLLGARDRGALIYGECGGFMVLGKTLTDAKGNTFNMSGLLPHCTSIEKPRRILGYRQLRHSSPLPWNEGLSGHEFHYSTVSEHNLPPLFHAKDALGNQVAPLGAMLGRVMGSYAHVIDLAIDLAIDVEGEGKA